MCGIFGIIKTDGFEKKFNNLNSLSHRGPDDYFFYESQKIFLSHSRLKIMDKANGRQPFIDNERKVVTAVNGEIYNFSELRASLVQEGIKFKTSSDCEVIHQGYMTYGESFFHKLIGIFAFSIWDEKKEKLILCRDHAGVKPLYYHHDKDNLSFSSEIKSLIIEAGVDPQVCNEALTEYLFYRYVRSNKTLFNNIYKLLPGDCLIVRKGEIEIKKLTYSNQDIGELFPEKRHKFLSTLNEVVRSQLISDGVNFGVYLSGGIDSSSIAAISSIFSPQRLFSYCVEFDDYPDNSEATFAKLVGEHFNTNHKTLTLKMSDIKENLLKIAWHYDEPMGDAAIIPTYFVSRLANEDSVKVVFAGEGADELFAGYTKYKEMIEAFKKNNFSDMPEIWEKNISVFNLSELSSLGFDVNEIKDELNSESFLSKQNIDDFVQSLLETDQESMLSENYLMKADKMTMAFGIEERVPFLDQRIVSFARQLSWKDMSTRYDSSITEKAILKDSLHTILPVDIISRKKKGYGTPTDIWFKNDMYDLLINRLNKSSILASLDTKFINHLLDEHKNNLAKNNVKLWSLLALDLWHFVHIKNKSRIDDLNLEKYINDAA